MIQSNYFTDNSDLTHFFQDIIDWKEIVSNYEHGFLDAKEFESTGKSELSMAPKTVEEAIDYYKSILVPGIERMPFFRVLRPLGQLVHAMGGTSGSLGTQDTRGVFTHSQTQNVGGPVICYESIYVVS